jgi:hypothetical protein
MDRRRPIYAALVDGSASTASDQFADIEDMVLLHGLAAQVELSAHDGLPLENDPHLYVYWDVVEELRMRGSRSIFEAATVLVASEIASHRALGCDVLNNLGYQSNCPYDTESADILQTLCEREDDPMVLTAALEALTFHTGRLRIDVMVAQRAHPDKGVRRAVAAAVATSARSEWVKESNVVAATLIELTADAESDVRDSATFYLARILKVDGPSIRAALRARLDDLDEDVRTEARAGLALRHDCDAVQLIRAAIESDDVYVRDVHSAGVLGDPTLSGSLADLQDWWDVDTAVLDVARLWCDQRLIDERYALMGALGKTLEHLDIAIELSSDLLDDDGDVFVRLCGESSVWFFDPLMKSCDGSAERAAQRLIDCCCYDVAAIRERQRDGLSLD